MEERPGRPRHRWQDIIKKDFREIDDMNFIWVWIEIVGELKLTRSWTFCFIEGE
jgi:hypothetical protein